MIEQKLKDLEKSILNPNNEDLEGIERLRKTVSKMNQYESFLHHPVTREVVDKIVQWIEETNLLLLDGRSIINKEREEAIIKRDLYAQILMIFSPNRVNYANLERHIDHQIKEFSQFFKR